MRWLTWAGRKRILPLGNCFVFALRCTKWFDAQPRFFPDFALMKTRVAPILIAISLVCVGPLPKAPAVSPPPDGGYPGGNTAEGQSALLSLTTGTYNSAVGIYALLSLTTGNFNTANGAAVLLSNTASENTATGAATLFSTTTGGFNSADGAFALFFNTTGQSNTAVGDRALQNNTTGQGNIALGTSAGINLTTGSNNIDIGNVGMAGESNTMRVGDPAIHSAIFVAGITTMTPAAPNQMVLVDPTSGQLGSADIPSSGVVSTSPENTAVGDQALVSNTGGFNTATGFQALFSNTSADNNTAVGDQALLTNTGPNNTAVGAGALSSNAGSPDPNDDLGAFNNAVGANSLFFNAVGSSNNALGESALLSNVSGSDNTAIGDVALENNDSSGTGEGSANTAVGAGALFSNTDGTSNNAVGFDALGNNTVGSFNNAMGYGALNNNTSDFGNIAIGDSSGQNVTTANNVICIGTNVAGADVSNSCYIGNVSGEPGGSQAVYVNADGKLGFQVSSRRFKDEITPMDKTSEAIYALKPVSFRYKKEVERMRPLGFGLIAEDVQKVNPDLVVFDANGNPASVRYDAVNAMLLNEFLKAHRKMEEQEATITRLQNQVETLTAGLQKVSAQLEVSKPAPQTVSNNQ